MRSEIEIATLTSERELDQARAEWNALLGESSSDTVFLTWEWLSAWWRAYGGGRTLEVLRFLRNGRLVGVAPTWRGRERGIGFLPYRLAALLGDGSGDSDYLDLFALPGEEPAVFEAFLGWTLRASPPWDVFRLSEIPTTSPFLGLFRDAARREGWFWEETAVGCPYVELPGDWDAYLRSLKPRIRTKLRSLERKLEEAHRISVDRCEDSAHLPGRLDSLFDMHARRWALEGKPGVFATPAKRSFYLEMSRSFLEEGWLRFYSLAVDGRPVAHQFCFERKGTIFLLQEAFEPEWQEHGVGNVLRARVFRDCIERGTRVYDFLGGVTSHKLSWGAKIKASHRVEVGKRGLRTALRFLVPRTVRWGKKRVGRILARPDARSRTVEAGS